MCRPHEQGWGSAINAGIVSRFLSAADLFGDLTKSDIDRFEGNTAHSAGPEKKAMLESVLHVATVNAYTLLEEERVGETLLDKG